MKLHKITWILLIVGGLNWLLTGLISSWDLANYLGSTIAMVVYILVGLSAVYELFYGAKRPRHSAPAQAAM